MAGDYNPYEKVRENKEGQKIVFSEDLDYPCGCTYKIVFRKIEDWHFCDEHYKKIKPMVTKNENEIYMTQMTVGEE